MRTRIKRENRKSTALSLSPEELVIILPDSASTYTDLNKLLNSLPHLKGPQFFIPATKEELHALIEKWVNKLQVQPKRIQLRRMKNKWASCSINKNVIFNSLLIGMPIEFVEYVICHDLLHIKVPKHNKLFRNLLSAYMPNWKERVMGTMSYILPENTNEMFLKALKQIIIKTEGEVKC